MISLKIFDKIYIEIKKKGFLEIRNYGEMRMNTFMDSLIRQTNFTKTENGAVAHKSTLNKVYDMFALGGAYRDRSDEDCILLFKNALEENETLALKCLFYLRDIRGGQGERRFFRICYSWLAKEYPEIAKRNLTYLSTYGRYDDLYCVIDTPVEKNMFNIIKTQLEADMFSYSQGDNVGVSLLAKWLKSENASSKETKYLANKTRKALGLSHKAYRQILSKLRTRINIVEKLMSENRWDEIEYDKIPSKAGLMYRNAFAARDAERYKEFMASKETKVNTGTNYPYEIVREVTKKINIFSNEKEFSDEERNALNKYWINQKDYLNGKPAKMLGVIDTSGSMTCMCRGVKPIDVAISLGMYAAERVEGPFKNHYISFASQPQLIRIEGIDFVDKVKRICKTNLVDNTNIKAAFDLIKNTALQSNVNKDDIPNTLVIISDMQIDCMSYWRDESIVKTEMEKIREEWKQAGLEMPHLVYWNVNASRDTILDGDEATYVSGCSPVIYESILTGKTGIQLMLDKLNSERYAPIK